jgi:hypothetical protein
VAGRGARSRAAGTHGGVPGNAGQPLGARKAVLGIARPATAQKCFRFLRKCPSNLLVIPKPLVKSPRSAEQRGCIGRAARARIEQAHIVKRRTLTSEIAGSDRLVMRGAKVGEGTRETAHRVAQNPAIVQCAEKLHGANPRPNLQQPVLDFQFRAPAPHFAKDVRPRARDAAA